MTLKLYDSFSTAIREGAKLRPQAFGSGFRDHKSCALSAGAEAVCGSPRTCHLNEVLAEHYAYMDETREISWCPANHCATTVNLSDMVIHLNDHHNWTRERIADWLEAEEEKLGFVTVTTDAEPVNEMTLETTTEESKDVVSALA